MADLLEGIRKDVPSYCDMSSEFQDILLAETYPRGITVDFQNPVNKRFGITHSLRLTGKPPQSPFAPPQPAGGPSHRSYSIGAYLLNRHGTQISASHCVSTGLATLNVDHKWRQGLKSRLNVYVSDAQKLFGVTTTYRGSDYTADFRIAQGPLFAASYMQRINDSWHAGAEALFSHVNMQNSITLPVAVTGGGRTRPLAYTMAVAYNHNNSKFAWLVDQTQVTCSRFHMYVRHDVTDNSTLVAKFITSFPAYSSLCSVGYKVRMPRTRSELTGIVDTYGNVKGIFERRLLTNTRLGVSVHANPTKQGHDNKLGVHLQIGFLPKKQVSNSPCLLHEPIFHN